jgi:hypothetical protein
MYYLSTTLIKSFINYPFLINHFNQVWHLTTLLLINTPRLLLCPSSQGLTSKVKSHLQGGFHQLERQLTSPKQKSSWWVHHMAERHQPKKGGQDTVVGRSCSI